MDCDEDSSRCGHGSNFVGAIFMCNRTTKKECLKRKLFGLPMSQADFVKKVKTGMFLFLFEYERRELYGVFEATTDGAINIAPKAYSKSGSSFPAQVHFKSLWICHPLSENEFQDAICENYFAPKKFNFGLSFKQVAKLVELFSLKKKSSRNRDSLDKDNSVSVDLTEQCAMNDMYSKCGLGVHHSMFNENPVLVLEDPNASIEHRSYPRITSGLRPHLPNSTCSSSPIDHSGEQSYSVGSKSPFHYTVPCFEGEQPSDVLGASKPYFAQTLTETQALHIRTCPYLSYPDPETYNFSATKYHKQDSFNEFGVDVPNSTRRFTEAQVPPISSNSFLLEQGTGTLRSHSYCSHQVPTTFRLPSTDNHGHVSSLHDEYLPLQTERYLNFNYDSSTFKAYATNATDYLHSVHGLSNTHRYAETSKEVDSARGMRYWKLLPNSPNLPLVEDDLPSCVSGRYSSEPCDADVYSKEEEHYFSKGSSTSASSKLQPEMFLRRTSVFSRLSKAPKSFSSRDDVHNADKNSSLDLLKLLSQRRNQWKKMSKASKRSFPRLNDDDDKRLENVDSMEPVDAELASESAVVNEESMELPFINFKRRGGSKYVDDKTEGTFKRRKLIRPSSAENDPTDSENKDISALEASFGNKEHMNPKDNVEGAETVVPTDTTDQRILGSKENIKDMPKAGANTENFPVDSGAECSKASVENNDVNFDKILNATHKAERKEELTLAADTKRDGSKPVENGEKNTFGRNSKQLSQASVISVEGAGTEEHSIFKSDFEYEGNKSTMLLDLNSKATYLESNANISKLDSATMEEERAGVGMNKHNISKSDLKFDGNRLDGLNETVTMFLDLNCEATFLESDASVLNINSATMEADRASESNQSRAIIKSREDNRKDGRLSYGNRENVSPIFDSARIAVNNESGKVARNSTTSTAELKSEGNNSDLPT